MSIKPVVIATVMVAQTYVAYRAYKTITKKISELSDVMCMLSDDLNNLAGSVKYQLEIDIEDVLDHNEINSHREYVAGIDRFNASFSEHVARAEPLTKDGDGVAYNFGYVIEP